MSRHTPRETLAEEARSVFGSVRARLEEWSEEGLECTAAAVTSEAPASGSHEPVADVSAEATSATPGADPAAGTTLATGGGDLSAGAASAALEAVRAELGECTRCGLHERRTQIVFGDGNPDADLLFVGEGPGEQEDRQGIPFVGRAGELLTQMIENGLGIPRSSVYICNVVKCRPPNNRTPLPDEVSTCSPFLEGQIAAINPKVIIALGKPAASRLLGREVPITRVRGTWHEYQGIPLMPTLHPAYILRQYTPENRRNVWNDLKAALARANES